MKTTVKQIITASALTIMIASCGGKTKNDTSNNSEIALETKENGLIDLDLSTTKAKFAVIAKAPKDFLASDGNENEVKINNKKIGVVLVKVDEKTSIENFKRAKKNISGDKEILIFEKFTIDTPDSFMAKVKKGYVIMKKVKVDNAIYLCAVDFDLIPENEADAKILFDIMGSLTKK